MRIHSALLSHITTLAFTVMLTPEAQSAGFYLGPKLSKIYFVTDGKYRGSKGSVFGFTGGYKFDGDDPFRLHLDYDFGECVRNSEDDTFKINCSGLPKNTEFLYRVLTIGLDYLHPVSKKMFFFIGPHIGNSTTDVRIGSVEIPNYSYYSGVPSHSYFELSGTGYGGQFGLIYNYSDSIELEFGFRSTWNNIKNNYSTMLIKTNPEAEGPVVKYIRYGAANLDQVMYSYLKMIYIF